MRTPFATVARTRLPAAAAAILLTIVTLSASDNWPSFRGPHAGVIDDDPALPDRWSATENVVWKTEVPGLGWSSPIIWGDTIFVTSTIGNEAKPKPGLDLIEEGKFASYAGGMREPLSTTVHRWMLYAIDFGTGRIRWERQLKSGAPMIAKHPKNSFASETPVTDGRHIYILIGDEALIAVDMKGAIAWSKPIVPPHVRPDPQKPEAPAGVDFGTGASPVLYKNRIFVLDDHENKGTLLVAFNAATGDELWRAHREKTGKGTRVNWSTPFLWENAVRTEIVITCGNSVCSYDLDGKLLWELSGLSTNTTPTPFAAHGLLFVTSGYPGDTFRPGYAIRPGGSGDISLKGDETSNQYVAWSQRQIGTYMPSALVYGDYIYNLYSQGFFQCNEAKTGTSVYGRQRIDVDASGFTASPWAYNGKIFALSEDGDTYVIQPGPEFKVLGKNSLGEMALATPAVLRGSLIVRTASSLYRIARTGGPKKRAAK